jgi:predicted transcriptional regulator
METRDTCLLRVVAVETIVGSKQDLIDIHCSTKVKEVFNLMRSWNLSCLAVYGQPNRWIGAGFVELFVNGKQYIGLVSLMDILNYMYQTLDPIEIEQRMGQEITHAIGSTNESMTLFLEMFSKPVLSAMEQFCKGTHYAVAVNDRLAQSNPKMLSQTDIVGFLVDSAASSAPMKRFLETTTVSDHFSRAVVVVNIHAPLSSILPLLLTVSAAPVVNEQNIPVTVISATHFKSLRDEDLEGLDVMNVEQLLVNLFQESLPLFSTEDESVSLLNICRLMLLNRRRRVWISYGDGDEIGVITMTDVIRVVYQAFSR